MHVQHGTHMFDNQAIPVVHLLLLKCTLVVPTMDVKTYLPTNVFFSSSFFKNMGQSRPIFVYFRSFLIIISTQIEKSIDGELGIRTRGRRMLGADETTELWRPPYLPMLIDNENL